LKKYALIAAVLFLTLGASGSGARAFHFGGSYPVPERLVYDLKWSFIKAGTATLSIERTVNGKLRITSTAVSADWISVFYPVKDMIESIVEGEPPWSSETYRLKTREGRHRKDKEVRFYPEEGKAIYIDKRKNKVIEKEVPRDVNDPLSAFYRVRALDLVPGNSSHVTVFDSKRVYEVEVKVLKKERVKVPAGKFDTILIKPLLTSEGIFARKGEIRIWLTDDERKIPVRLKSKVKIGHIDAELVRVEYE
jgi:hypothetical protein